MLPHEKTRGYHTQKPRDVIHMYVVCTLTKQTWQC